MTTSLLLDHELDVVVGEPAQRPRFELASVLSDALDAYVAAGHALRPESRKRLRNVLVCRTAELGGHLQHCERCGLDVPAYNSCRDRHCPKCQALDQLRWYEARSARGLPVRYFHAVLTLPGRLRPLFLANRSVLYAVLMRTATRVVLDVASERLGGARAGLVAVLHTWNAQYRYHPHVHMIVPGGGLAKEGGEWVQSENGSCLLPADLLRERFAPALLSAIELELESGTLLVTDGLDQILERLASPDVYWHGYAKRTLEGAEAALRYLARYACRPGFSNERILSYDGKTVVYATKHGGHVTATNTELLRFFLQHELPKGFMRIRYYGILSGRVASKNLALARASLSRQDVPVPPPAPPPSANETFVETWKRLRGVDLSVCPRCEGPVSRIPFTNAAHEQRLREHLVRARRLRLGRARDP